VTCTTYNEPINYDHPVSYNGTCLTPVPGGGGFGAFSDVFSTPFPDGDEEGMVIVLLGLLEDDN
jgi:hypothetical protein